MLIIEPEDLRVCFSAKREVLVSIVNEEKKEAIVSYFQSPRIKQKVRNMLLSRPYTSNETLRRLVAYAMNSVLQAAPTMMEVE